MLPAALGTMTVALPAECCTCSSHSQAKWRRFDFCTRKATFGENAPCQNRAGVAKGLHDRNSPICTLSQNGYGGKSSVLFVQLNLDQKFSGMASQSLGGLQDASQDVGSISKIRHSVQNRLHWLPGAPRAQNKTALEEICHTKAFPPSGALFLPTS